MNPVEARINPTGDQIAWRFGGGEWSTQQYGGIIRWIHAAEVADWAPLAPVPPPPPDRVTCPWCGRPDRKLTTKGRIRQHVPVTGTGASLWDECAGSGRTPSEYAGAVPE